MSYIKDSNGNLKPVEKLLDQLATDAIPGSIVYNQIAAATLVKSNQDISNTIKALEISINKNAKSNDDLANKVLWLNRIITLATITATVTQAITLYLQWTKP